MRRLLFAAALLASAAPSAAQDALSPDEALVAYCHGAWSAQSLAIEQGWDVRTFLEETCLKAGLPSDAVARGAIVEAFSAQVFSEEGRGAS